MTFLSVLLAVVLANNLKLDILTVVESFKKEVRTIPVGVEEHCNLQPGHDRVLLTFDGYAINTDNETVARLPQVFDWNISCPGVTRSGNITLTCINDACAGGKFFSCATNGVSPGCRTRVYPAFCDSIDVTEANESVCNLTLDGEFYVVDLAVIPFHRTNVWRRFVLNMSIYTGSVIIAGIYSAIKR